MATGQFDLRLRQFCLSFLYRNIYEFTLATLLRKFLDRSKHSRFNRVPLTEGKWKYSLPGGWFNAGEGLEVHGYYGGYRC